LIGERDSAWEMEGSEYLIARDEGAGLSEVVVAGVTAAVQGAMVCFVLVVIAGDLAELPVGMIDQVGVIGQVGLVGALVMGIWALAVRSRWPGGRR